MPLRRSTASRRSIGARSAVNVGQPRWSSTNASAVCRSVRRQAQHRRTMFEPCSPHTHDVRTTAAAGRARAPRAPRPASTGRTPSAGSVASHSWYGPVERAVEHVVGRDVHEVGADAVARLGAPSAPRGRWPRRPGPDRSRRRRPRSTPRSGRRRRVGSRRRRRARRRDRSRRARRGRRRRHRRRPTARRHDVVTELPAGAGDEHPRHVSAASPRRVPSATGARSRSGSHQARLVGVPVDRLGDARHPTRPSAAQPSSARIFDQSST